MPGEATLARSNLLKAIKAVVAPERWALLKASSPA